LFRKQASCFASLFRKRVRRCTFLPKKGMI
jgi:hypothetical protein